MLVRLATTITRELYACGNGLVAGVTFRSCVVPSDGRETTASSYAYAVCGLWFQHGDRTVCLPGSGQGEPLGGIRYQSFVLFPCARRSVKVQFLLASYPYLAYLWLPLGCGYGISVFYFKDTRGADDTAKVS